MGAVDGLVMTRQGSLDALYLFYVYVESSLTAVRHGAIGAWLLGACFTSDEKQSKEQGEKFCFRFVAFSFSGLMPGEGSSTCLIFVLFCLCYFSYPGRLRFVCFATLFAASAPPGSQNFWIWEGVLVPCTAAVSRP